MDICIYATSESYRWGCIYASDTNYFDTLSH